MSSFKGGSAPRSRSPETRRSKGLSPQDQRILQSYSPENRQTIEERLQNLSAVGQFVGKDFDMPVRLSQKGEGWYWRFDTNETFIDPQELLEKPLEYCRFSMAHEGAHRRITPTDFLDEEIKKEGKAQSYRALVNVIEDPRVNNWLAENYPSFSEGMRLYYEEQIEDFDTKVKEIAAKKTGVRLRTAEAQTEYMHQWWREAQRLPSQFFETTSTEVKAVVQKTLTAASGVWWTYPTRVEIEGEKGKEVIAAYAKVMKEGVKKKIWPEFKKLIDEDVEDIKEEQALKDAINKAADGDTSALDDIKKQLTEAASRELDDLVEQAAKQKEEKKRNPGEPPDSSELDIILDLSDLSDELKKKIQEYIKSLPKAEQDALADAARIILEGIEAEISEEIRGKLMPPQDEDLSPSEEESVDPSKERREAEHRREVEKAKERAEELSNAYEKARREVLPVIDELEQYLRELFVARRTSDWKTGFKRGKRIDISKRIQEKVKGVSAVQSKAWEQKEKPQAKDYAITVLLDLSLSMRGKKIQNAFKAVVAITEVFNRLSIKCEILGFNKQLYIYQRFDEPMSTEVRGRLSLAPVELEVGTDDGWAIDTSAERLSNQREQEKFLVVLSDGRSEPSALHNQPQYEITNVVSKVLAKGDIKLVGLGIGKGTEHVKEYYPHSMANVPVEDLAEALAVLFKDIIENYEKY